MIAFIVIAIAVFLVITKVLDGQWILSVSTSSIIVLGLTFLVMTANSTHNLISESERHIFNISGQKYEIYYDTQEEKYFTIDIVSYYNPFDWLGRRYIESADSERFFEAYESYQIGLDGVRNANPFG